MGSVGGVPCPWGVPCLWGSTMSVGQYHIRGAVPYPWGSTMSVGQYHVRGAVPCHYATCSLITNQGDPVGDRNFPLFWSQLNFNNVISPLFKSEPEIKVRIFMSHWTYKAGS